MGKKMRERQFERTGFMLRLDFFADTFFAKSIPVATFDEVTDEMFVPGWNLYCQTLESNNRGMGKKMDGQKDEGKTI